jgi:hypothetical protein
MPHDELKACIGPLSCLLEDMRREPSSRDPSLVIAEPSFPTQEKDVKFDFDKPISCQDSDQKDSHGNPVVLCEFISGDYEEWVEQLG